MVRCIVPKSARGAHVGGYIQRLVKFMDDILFMQTMKWATDANINWENPNIPAQIEEHLRKRALFIIERARELVRMEGGRAGD